MVMQRTRRLTATASQKGFGFLIVGLACALFGVALTSGSAQAAAVGGKCKKEGVQKANLVCTENAKGKLRWKRVSPAMRTVSNISVPEGASIEAVALSEQADRLVVFLSSANLVNSYSLPAGELVRSEPGIVGEDCGPHGLDCLASGNRRQLAVVRNFLGDRGEEYRIFGTSTGTLEASFAGPDSGISQGLAMSDFTVLTELASLQYDGRSSYIRGTMKIQEGFQLIPQGVRMPAGGQYVSGLFTYPQLLSSSVLLTDNSEGLRTITEVNLLTAKGTYHRPCPVQTKILSASAENKIVVSCYSSENPKSEVRIYDLSTKANVLSRPFSQVRTATMSKDGSKLFVAHGPEGQVMLSMVDTKSSQVIGDERLTITPSDLIYDEATGRLVAAPSWFSPQPNNVIQLLDVSSK